METKTLIDQFLELSEKIMLGSEAGEFIAIEDVHAYNDTIRKLYDSGEWEK